MDAKFVIFVAISSVLLAAVYSSTSSNYASATISNTCTDSMSKDKKFHIITCCTVRTDDEGNVQDTICKVTVCPAGNGNCVVQEKPAGAKTPNSDLLNDNSVLQGDNNTSNDNTKEPKAPKVPEDLGGLNEDNGPQ